MEKVFINGERVTFILVNFKTTKGMEKEKWNGLLGKFIMDIGKMGFKMEKGKYG